jgi:hypothetical protein
MEHVNVRGRLHKYTTMWSTFDCDDLVAEPSLWSLDLCTLHTYDDGEWHDASGGADLARVANFFFFETRQKLCLFIN